MNDVLIPVYEKFLKQSSDDDVQVMKFSLISMSSMTDDDLHQS